MPASKRQKPPLTPQPDSPSAAGERSPEVIVDFVFENGLLFIALQNISAEPAFDVRVRFDKRFHGAGGEVDVSALRMFKATPFLAPRKTIRSLLDASAAYFQRREPTLITAKIVYQDAEGREHSRSIRHDLAIYQDISFVAGTVSAAAPLASDPTNP